MSCHFSWALALLSCVKNRKARGNMSLMYLAADTFLMFFDGIPLLLAPPISDR